MFDFLRKRKPRNVPLEAQLEELAGCGITLREADSLDRILEEWPREQIESDPYTLLLCAMGTDDHAPPWLPLSRGIWHMDTERIEDHGDYKIITSCMAELARADLPITEVNDHVDINEGVIWLEFNLHGRPYHWDVEVNDDWVDMATLARFAQLIPAACPRRFSLGDTGGQDCLVGFATPKELDRLRGLTGLRWEWLK